MKKVAEKNGARIHLTTPIKKVENGEKIAYDSVVINADF